MPLHFETFNRPIALKVLSKISNESETRNVIVVFSEKTLQYINNVARARSNFVLEPVTTRTFYFTRVNSMIA